MFASIHTGIIRHVTWRIDRSGSPAREIASPNEWKRKVPLTQLGGPLR